MENHSGPVGIHRYIKVEFLAQGDIKPVIKIEPGLDDKEHFMETTANSDSSRFIHVNVKKEKFDDEDSSVYVDDSADLDLILKGVNKRTRKGSKARKRIRAKKAKMENNGENSGAGVDSSKDKVSFK